MKSTSSVALLIAFGLTLATAQADRFNYLEDHNPYYVGLDFPKLTTPQWIGEEGVDAVVILSIDDMRNSATYESYLRPILERLKQIDGRAPVSIFTNSIDAQDPQLQQWLKEGLSLEIHTIDHPCPCLSGGDFARAKSTYDRCVDLMASIPNNRPAAFRMPCCDSLNTPSPRFWAEIFNKTTEQGNYLTIDSSVFNITTANDPAIPMDLALDESGNSRFEHYIPFDSFVNVIKDYPYPFVQGQLCWQFPCVIPSDWEGQNVQRPFNPKTVEDMKHALDATVIKKGVYPLVFHPHGWIRNSQIIDIIDHAVKNYGNRVKFLTFRECADRIQANLLSGQSLRNTDGGDNGVRIVDLNDDGFLDVAIGNDQLRKTRIWDTNQQRWEEFSFPTSIANSHEQFFTHSLEGTSLLVNSKAARGVWQLRDSQWRLNEQMLAGLPEATADGIDNGLRMRDIDQDGFSEMITNTAVLRWDTDDRKWQPLPFSIPDDTSITNEAGLDAGLRFVDIDDDGLEDIIFSDDQTYSLHLFSDMKTGWDNKLLSGSRPEQNEIPIISLGGTNYGSWFSERYMWVQNEFTQGLPALVDRRSFDQLLANAPPKAKSPESALKAFETQAGFKVELVASEPLVMDPVAFDWDSKGRLWVIEMADYPLGLDNKGKPGGRVRFLTDTDADGKYDKSTLFADGIGYPSDVMVWRDGVLISAAPNIWYMEDSNGDGKADIKTAVYTGFGEGNQQHRVNGLRWGLDNWVHLANGDSGGVVRSSKTEETINIGGRDLRIRPDTGELQALTGQTQHGRNRDDWGNWWGANNSNPMFQYVLQDQYLARNPHISYPNPRHAVATLQNSPIFPISRVMSHWEGYRPPPPGAPSRFTSACSTIVYRDQYLGKALHGDMFVSAPVHNLVHRRSISFDGLLMHSTKPNNEEGSEFVRSRDSWFRPTTIRTGPDGALWIADIYRIVIEHPQWIDDRREQELDLREGHDKGRIYRVIRDTKEPPTLPDFDNLSAQSLVNLLESTNGWVRDYAHRQLLWHKDPVDIAPALVEALGTSKSALQRLHALCVLDGIDQLSIADLGIALSDNEPQIVRHAVRISEQFSTPKPDLDVINALMVLATVNKDPFVAQQLAYSLGEFDHPRAGHALGTVMVRHQEDPFVMAAAYSSLSLQPADALLAVRQHSGEGDDPSAHVARIVSTVVGLGDNDTVSRVISELIADGDEASSWQFAALSEIQNSLATQQRELIDLITTAESKKRLSEIQSAARQLILTDGTDPAIKIVAANLAISESSSSDVELLLRLLSPQSPVELQQIGARLIASATDLTAANAAIAKWKTLGPLARDRVVAAMLTRENVTLRLLEAIESSDISALDLTATHRQIMLAHESDSVRIQATRLFGMTSNAERERLIAEYLPVVKAGGDIERGFGLFSKTCAQCHKLRGIGHEVGPSLAGLLNKSAEHLTTHVLDPDKAIEDKFRNYTVITTDGRIVNGLLTNESANSITIAGPNSQNTQVRRSDIEQDGFKRNIRSMMPTGLEKYLTASQLADVVAFVQANQNPPKQFDGNKPTVKSFVDGAIRLTASVAEIYGPTVVYESRFKNIGFWQNLDDRVIWTALIPTEGEYDIYMDWAVDNGAANQGFICVLGDKMIKGRVEGTGTWEDYQQKKIGTVELSAGLTRVMFRADEGLQGFLIDLREICLVPAGMEPPKGLGK
ncbi:MAG: PVC-type heme-binding CxxCH protein [Pirellulaceae bacterium]